MIGHLNENIMKLLIFVILVIGKYAQTASPPPAVEALLAEPNEFPWMARLVSYFVKNDSSTYFRGPCTGSLIARQWVLTTARCIVAQPGNQLADGVRIHLGKYDLKNPSEAGEEFLLAREFYVHPDYNPSISMSDNDFALIKLPRPVAVTLQVQPIQLPDDTSICLPNYQETDDTVDQCTAGSTLGWPRASRTQTKHRFLHMVKLDVQSFRTCTQTFNTSENPSKISDLTAFTSSKFCASGVDSQIGCSIADAGAPFTCRIAGNRVLIGLFLNDVQESTNLATDPSEGCASGTRTSIFGRVCSIMDWIDSLNMTDMGSPQLVYQPGSYPIRLSGDPAGNGTRGYVEFYYNNTWGTVCDDNFNDNSARVACAQLGHTNHLPRIDTRKSGLYKPASKRPIWLDEVVCNGFESNLAVCRHQPYGVSDCSHNEDVVVECKSNNAFSPALVYDPQSTQILDGTFRLFGGTSNDTGFLEVWYNGQWGAVCDDGFSQAAVSVACRHLGFVEVRAEMINSQVYIQRSDAAKIWLDDFVCTGLEQSLLSCQHNEWGDHNCGPSESVAIRCAHEPLNVFDFSSSRIEGIRLTGSPNNKTGFVEILINDNWGTVCGERFGVEVARIACRMLGFFQNARVVNPNHIPFASSQPYIWLDNVVCQGNETTLLECMYRTSGERNCDHSEDLAVYCDLPVSNETSVSQVRFVGSNNNSSGIIEVFNDNQWGTVCNDGFNGEEARVVCRQLGFNSSQPTLLPTSIFNSSSVAFQIWLDDVRCQGTEDSIYQCQHRGWGEHNCGHSEDVALNCLGGIYGTLSNDPGTNGQVRLVGSSSANASSGFVEIYWTLSDDRGWGAVCDDNFGIESAKVVCRQLGFSPEYAQLLTSTANLTRSTSTAFWLDEVNCEGEEQSLVDCTHNEWGIHNCLPTENVGISCLPTDANRAPDVSNSTTTEEGPVKPGMPGNIRLTGGDNATVGFVEFYWNGRWGTVCDDGFTISAAQVVCRQLNLSTEFAQIDSSTGLVPSRYRQIWLDDVVCSGAETNLTECTHNDYGVHNCHSTENVVVSCSAELYRSTTTTRPSFTGLTQPASVALEPGVEGQVRLTGSTEPGTGFVEIYWLDRWGTVCDDFFGVASAHVVCRQLGYTDMARVNVLLTNDGLARSAASTMWLDDVRCLGSEQNLASCPHQEWGEHNCNADESVSITCMRQAISNVPAIPTTTTPSTNPASQDYDLNFHLAEAVKTNQTALVDRLLRKGASPNGRSPICCNYNNAPILTCAACAGYVQIASLLVANGADLEASDSALSGTALIWAAEGGFLDVVRLLVNSGADIDATTHTTEETALAYAISAGNLEVVRYLVDSGADLTAQSSSGMTPAQLARSLGFEDIADYLESLVSEAD